MPQPDRGIWPHLPSAFGPERPQANKQSSVGAAMWPSLGPQSQSKPKPAPNRYSENTTLAQRCDADPMFEAGLALMGLRRIRRR
jgi:hypothetical protein